MKPKRRRLYFVGAGMTLLAAAAGLALYAMNDSLVFFYSPSELVAKRIPPGRILRIGGLVEEGSVMRAAGGTEVRFRVTDMASAVSVVYAGILPDLFREGQGVVAQGRLDANGVFVAAEVLAKHDEPTCRRKLSTLLRAPAAGRMARRPNDNGAEVS